MALASDLTSQCQQQSVGPGNALTSTLLQALLALHCAISPPDIWPNDYGQTASRYGLGTYDFVVIGAGSAGSIVASRLSENPAWKILVLEAGGDPPIESEIPSQFYEIQHTAYNWDYFTEYDGKSCLGYQNQVCYWPRGKMIGGTGAINAMLYVRGNRQDYDNWELKGNPYWGWDHVLPVFENSIDLSADNATDRGGLMVNPFEVDTREIRTMLFEGAAELGVPRVEAVREGCDIGYTTIPGTVRNGRRSSSGKSFLARAKDRPNLHVIKNAVVSKINVDRTGQQVTGVTFTYKKKRRMTVKVAKEVVVSAGTLESPKLLMLSGIGPQDHLKKLGIPLVKDLRVGDNLQDHVVVPVVFKINDSKLRKATLRDQLDITYQYLIDQTGPLASHGTASVAGFINADPTSSSPYPDIINYNLIMPSGTQSLDTWIRAVGFTESIEQSIRSSTNDHLMAVYVALQRPKSIGTLRLKSSDPKDPPKLFANYLEQQDDIESLLRGIHFQMQMEQTAAFREQEAEIIRIDLPECDQFPFKGDEYWKCYLKYMTNTMYHVAGTVKMGPDTDYAAVLDWRLRVKGIRGLRVADASVMPDIVTANTNAPTMMIAERAAAFIADDWNGLSFE